MNYIPLPTLTPLEKWDKSAAPVEAKMLMNAIRSFDTAGIIKMLTTRNSEQRMAIREAYESEFGANLVKDLKTEFDGDFKLLTVGLMQAPMDYAARRINKSIGRAGLNIKHITEILAQCSNEDAEKIKQYYKKVFGDDLTKKLNVEFSGALLYLFTSMLNNNRDEDLSASHTEANRHAVELMAVIEVTPDKLEEFFIDMITKQSPTMLRIIFYEYGKLNSDQTVDKLVDQMFNGDARTAIKIVVDLVRNAPNYYAGRLFKAMDGWVFDSSMVMFILTSRCEIDLGNIKAEYKTCYNRDLAKDIKSRTTGDYRRCLLTLLGKD